MGIVRLSTILRNDEGDFMVIKSVIFQREKGSKAEKGLCIESNGKILFFNENLEVVGTDEDRRAWDSHDTMDYIFTIDFRSIT